MIYVVDGTTKVFFTIDEIRISDKKDDVIHLVQTKEDFKDRFYAIYKECVYEGPYYSEQMLMKKVCIRMAKEKMFLFNMIQNINYFTKKIEY